jgi:hypothetical protein
MIFIVDEKIGVVQLVAVKLALGAFSIIRVLAPALVDVRSHGADAVGWASFYARDDRYFLWSCCCGLWSGIDSART